jgi:hypothetical protein
VHPSSGPAPLTAGEVTAAVLGGVALLALLAFDYVTATP